MPRKTKASQPPARIRGFTSLDNHEAAQQEGKIVVGEIGGFQVRRIWYRNEWWHAVVDVIGALTESADPGTYWRVHKTRLRKEGGDETVTNCNGFKLPAADGKMRETDCATTATMFRIIESIPSKRAEPIKQYLAMAGAERLKDAADPSRTIDRAIDHYRELGPRRRRLLVRTSRGLRAPR